MVITGATSGIGAVTARALAGAGARVIIASRNAVGGDQIVREIRQQHPGAEVRFESLDLSDLSSVAACAQRILEAEPRIDLLINNAAVMAIPTRMVSPDGFELQFATNHLGHFAWTLQLLPAVLRAPAPRLVVVSSMAYRQGRIDFDDLQGERRYQPWRAYSQSKLANLMFCLELDERSRVSGSSLRCFSAHPGFARTGLQTSGPRMGSKRSYLFETLGLLLRPFLSHSAEGGALPTLLAATSPEANAGALYGPRGLFELKGPPAQSRILPRALDPAVRKRLWSVSETLTRASLPNLFFAG